MNDDEILELAAAIEGLTPEAQVALSAEIESRRLTPSTSEGDSADNAKHDERTRRPEPWHRGWITVFEAYIALLTLAFALGFVVAGGIEIGWNLMFAAGVLAVPVTGLLLTARRSPRAPAYWRIVLSVAVVISLLSFASNRSDVRLKALSNAAWNAAWLAYWIKSSRVAREFSPTSSVESVKG
jgi:anti-sigma factor RsiW